MFKVIEISDNFSFPYLLAAIFIAIVSPADGAVRLSYRDDVDIEIRGNIGLPSHDDPGLSGS